MELELKEAIVSSVKEGQAEIVKQVEELSAKVKQLEDVPVAKSVNIIVPEYYKGYKLNKQFEKYRKGEGEAQGDAISKMMIDVITNKSSLQKSAGNQTEGTDAKGGYLTIDAYDSVITATAREMSVMMSLVNNVTVGTTDTFKFNKQLANVALAWDSEGSITNTSATYSQDSISIKKLSGWLSISNELLADSAYDIVGDITEQFAFAMAQEMDNQILNGTGSPCSGVLTAAAGYSVVLSTGLSNFSSVTATDYSLAISKLSTVDANNATFVLGKLAAHYVRTLKDSTGEPIYQAIAGPDLDTIYGTPRVIANKITDTTAPSTAFAVLGDFRQFLLVNRMGGLDLLVDPYGDATSDNTRFIWKTRKGLGIKRASAFVRMLTAS